MSADIMLCYKNGRTAHLVARGDCLLPNNAVIWGTEGLLEVCASVHFVQEVVAERIKY